MSNGGINFVDLDESDLICSNTVPNVFFYHFWAKIGKHEENLSPPRTPDI